MVLDNTSYIKLSIGEQKEKVLKYPTSKEATQFPPIIFDKESKPEKKYDQKFYFLLTENGLEIGDNCSISAGVQIYSHDTVRWATSGGIEKVEYGSVKIGSNCYVGPNVVISKGITIGNQCVIGANSFVNRDIPNNLRAWGNPAKFIDL